MATVKAGRTLDLLKAAITDQVIVDTTVMPNAVAHPTDSRLLDKSRQNDNREAPRIAMQIGRSGSADCRPTGLRPCDFFRW